MTDLSQQLQDIDESIANWSEYLDDEHPGPVVKLIRDLQKQRKRLELVGQWFNLHGYGLTLKQSSLEQWVIVLPDASEPGRYRYQTFTADGFLGHSTRDTVADVLEEICMDGFFTLDLGALDRLSSTDRWKAGSQRLDIITRLNAGQIDWASATEQLTALA